MKINIPTTQQTVPPQAPAQTVPVDPPTMTNQSAQSSTLVTDVKPLDVLSAHAAQSVDTSKLKLKGIEDMTELDAIMSANIIAKPLAMPEGLSIRKKNKSYHYRWVAFKANGGHNLSRFLYMGFTKATTDDVETVDKKASEHPDGIIHGDLLLMKLPLEQYLSALKNNYIRSNVATARNRGHRPGQAQRELGRTAYGKDGKPLMSFYEPNATEIGSHLNAESVTLNNV
jgi:hypothetical protein